MEMGEERIKEIKEAFDLYDNDGSQTLGLTQLQNVLLCLGYDFSSKEMNSIMLEFGDPPMNTSNINSIYNNTANKQPEINARRITYNSLLTMLTKKAKESDAEEDIIDCFKLIDVNGTGKLGYDEIKYLMLLLGENFCDEEINEIITQVDSTGKGQIDYKDFVKMTLLKEHFDTIENK